MEVLTLCCSNFFRMKWASRRLSGPTEMIICNMRPPLSLRREPVPVHFSRKYKEHEIKLLIEEFETALIKGAVDIESNGNRLISLKPETKVILSKDGLKVLSIKHHNYFLWKDGIISFENENLEALMKKLELYYDIKIQIKSQKISTKRFTGKFRTKDGVEHVLRVLQLSIDFIYEKDEQNNIITIR